MDARGFELLCALSQKEDFMDLIKDKFSAQEKIVQDMTTFIEYQNVNGIQRPRAIPDHPVTKDELDKLWGGIGSRYKKINLG